MPAAARCIRLEPKHAILACWNMMIPYLCEELPDAQKEALAFATKVPLLYTNVLLRTSIAFQKLGANSIYAPGGYHTHVDMDLPVSMGKYRCPRTPEEPAGGAHEQGAVPRGPPGTGPTHCWAHRTLQHDV